MNCNYWKPADANVGDCMPFVHNGLFHVYYLRDIGHHNHPVVGPLGGHEWAHCVSSDLKHFEECPIALNLDFGSGECSNCTGSLFAHGEDIYAFYALRSRNFEGEQFRVAVSSDGGRTFRKCGAPELATPPPGYTRDFRDPSVFMDETGTIHLLLTTRRASTGMTSPALAGELLHYTTKDFLKYHFEGTFLRTNGIPECSELFRWGDYYYLFYSLNWETHALVSESFSGPWRVAVQDIPASRFCAVMKSAPWKNNRRIGVAWVPPHSPNGFLFGGKMIFRELLQNPDGSLGTSFLPEALAPGSGKISLEDREIAESGGLAQLFLGEAPEHFRLEGEIDFSREGAHSFGFQLSDTTGNFRHLIEFFPSAGRVEIDRTAEASSWDAREGKVFFRLERSGDILDLEFGGKRTLTVSGAEFSPAGLFFQVVGGRVALKNATLLELPEEKSNNMSGKNIPQQTSGLNTGTPGIIMREVAGSTCAPEKMQETVQKILDGAIADGLQTSAQCCVYLDGRLVVDAWAGTYSKDSSRKIDGASIFPVFSTEKPLFATAVHRAVELGKMDYDAKISDYWPEYGCSGKENTRLRHILSHRAGLPGVLSGISDEQYVDWKHMTELCAALTPSVTPGTTSSYLSQTFAWLLGEPLVRAMKKPLRDVLREQVLIPAGIDKEFYFGIDDEAESRCVTVCNGVEKYGAERMNLPLLRRACIPSAYAMGSARAIATFYLRLTGMDGKAPLLKKETLNNALQPCRWDGEPIPQDLDEKWQAVWGLGYGLWGKKHELGRIFGQAGLGGSEGLADLSNRIAIGYTCGTSATDCGKPYDLRPEIYRALGIRTRYS